MKSINHFLTMYTPTERELANEIATRLDDPAALSQWLNYARTVSHSFLRNTLDKVCAMPDHQITTTRVRLFVHIIENHIKYDNGYSRD